MALRRIPHYLIYFNEGELGGYWFCKHLQIRYGGPSVSVVRGVNDGVDYVRRMIKMSSENQQWDEENGPNEVAFFIEHDFPDEFFIRLISWNDHTTDEDREADQRRFSVVNNFCNGGDMTDLKVWFEERYNEIPEWFLWHVVRKMARAIAFMLLGYRQGRPLPATWDPMMQRDLTHNNIFLHWNLDTDDYPQLQLGDFGRAARLSDPVWCAGLQADSWAANLDGNTDDPSEEEIKIRGVHEDIQGLGYLLLDLVGMLEGVYEDREDDSFEDRLRAHMETHDNPEREEDEEEPPYGPNDPYSDDLRQLILDIHLLWWRLPDPGYPDGHYLIKHVIPLADRKFEELRGQIKRRPVKPYRKVVNNKLHWVRKPLDLFGDYKQSLRVTADLGMQSFQMLQPWTLLKMGIDITDLRQPNWVANFRQQRKHITPWAPDPGDGPVENLNVNVPDGEPVRIIESKIIHGNWIRYLTQHAGEDEPRWLKHTDFPGERRKLVRAFHMTYPNKRKGRQTCINALASP